MHVTLVLRDGLLEHLTIPASATAATAGSAGAAATAAVEQSKGSAAAKPASTTAGRISWIRLLHELVTATHAFSVEDDSPLMVDTPKKGESSAPASPVTKPSSAAAPPKAITLAGPHRDSKTDPKADAAAADNSTRTVADCFHITYNDDEGDLVTVSNEAGLLEAYRLAELNGKAVELSVTVLDMPPPLSLVTLESRPDFATIRSNPSLTAAAVTAPTPTPSAAPVVASAAKPAVTAAQSDLKHAAKDAKDAKSTAAPAEAITNPKPSVGKASRVAPAVEVAPGALPEAKLNPILKGITASVGDSKSAADAAADADEAIVAEQQSGAASSPFEAVCLKHLRRTLSLFESYHLNLSKDKYVAQTKLKQAFARVSPKTLNYELLKAKHEKALVALNTRFQSSVDLLVSEYDRYMASQSPASFLLPIYVTVSVENRGMRYEVPLRPVDCVADLRDLLMELSGKKSAAPGAAAVQPDPIVEFGPLSYFTLRRPPAAADGKAGAGAGALSPSKAAPAAPAPVPVSSPSASLSPLSQAEHSAMNFFDFLFGVGPRKSSAAVSGPKQTVTVIENENVTMHALGITNGCEFALVGGVRRRSEQPKCICGLRVPAEAALQYYNCVECKEHGLCRGCAMHCHFGHTIVLAGPADHPKPGFMPCLCGVAPVAAAAASGHAVSVSGGAASAVGAGVGVAGVSGGGEVKSPFASPAPPPLPVSSCRIRESAAAAPPYAQLYTEEVGLLRAMGFNDKALEHLTMTVPASAIAPVPVAPPVAAPPLPPPPKVQPTPPPLPPPVQPHAADDAKADLKRAGSSTSPVPVPAVPTPPPAPAPTPGSPPKPAPASLSSSPPRGAAAGNPPPPPLPLPLQPQPPSGQPQPLLQPQQPQAQGQGQGPAPVATVMVTVPVTLRALLQSKGGNVQAVVDTLLAWEKQGKLSAPNANANSASANANASQRRG